MLLIECICFGALYGCDTLVEYLLLLRVLKYLLVHFDAERDLFVGLREAAILLVLLQRH